MRRLAERQVAQTKAGQRLEESACFLQASHGHPGLVDAHRHDVGQAQPIAENRRSLRAVAAPPTLGALNVHVGQELHVQGDLPGPVACGASKRTRVVGECTWLQPIGPRLLSARKRPA